MATEGKLSIHVTKKGAKKFKANYTNAKGKTCSMPILPQARGFREDDARDGDSLLIELTTSGQIARATIPGKAEVAPTVQPPTTPPRKENFRPGGNRGYPPFQRPAPQPLQKPAPATAPYNFVPQDRVVEAPAAPQGTRYSGTLHCRLTALTPLLVCGAQEQKSTGDEVAIRPFCRVGKRPVIPGTSLKGMVRSMVETLSCSAMRMMNDRRVFWRNFDDTIYKTKFNMGNRDPQSNGPQKAGYLVHEGADFYIVPVPFKKIPPQGEVADGHVRVVTGPMPRKKHDYDFYPPPLDGTKDNERLAVSDEIMADFRLQITPEQEQIYTASKQRIAENEPLPVFFITNASGELEFFGLPRFFRVPKKYSPHGLGNATLKVKGKGKELPDDFTDFSDQLFGYARKQQCRKGHVAFSPAFFDQAAAPLKLPPVVLGQPHETCFAHYLQQDPAKLKTLPNNGSRYDVNSMSNYNEMGQIRGRKYYWHRDFDQSKLPPPSSNKKTQSILQPLPEKSSTTFAVHLDSVTLEQLGAMLTALRLPEGHAHKLGMGKSLGLGSVRIELLSSDIRADAERYADLAARCTALFAPQKNAAALPDGLFQQAENAFRAWVLQGFDQSPKNPNAFEQLPHVQALRRMTDFAHRPANDKTRNMDLEEFRNLRVLKQAVEVQ